MTASVGVLCMFLAHVYLRSCWLDGAASAQDLPMAEPAHMLAAGLWEDVALPALKKVPTHVTFSFMRSSAGEAPGPCEVACCYSKVTSANSSCDWIFFMMWGLKLSTV